ncbi:uncharacterized protein LOC135164666 [Diachasmimorpha longicaudata]|uniref:uncharacterized protein LOC135164666 n=1 Tax=Diachasmimorpha longicaudata TaxID=58733 RepID=UPI0030B88759
MKISLRSLLPVVLLATGSWISLSCANPVVPTKEVVDPEGISKTVGNADISQISADGAGGYADASAKSTGHLFRTRRSRKNYVAADEEKLCPCLQPNFKFKGSEILLRILQDISKFLSCAQPSLDDLRDVNWPILGDKASDGKGGLSLQNLAKSLLNDFISILLTLVNQSTDGSADVSKETSPNDLDPVDYEADITINPELESLIESSDSDEDSDLSDVLLELIGSLEKWLNSEHKPIEMLLNFEEQIVKLSPEDYKIIASRANSDPRCALLVEKKLKTIRSLSALTRTTINVLAALMGALKELQSSINTPSSLCSNLDNHNPTLSLFSVSDILTGKIRAALQSSSSSGEMCLPVDKVTSWISLLIDEFPQLATKTAPSRPLASSSSDCKTAPAITISVEDSNKCGQSNSKPAVIISSSNSRDVKVITDSRDNQSSNKNPKSPVAPPVLLSSIPKTEGASPPAPSVSAVNTNKYGSYGNNQSDEDDDSDEDEDDDEK